MFTEQELNQIRQVVREELKGSNKPPVKIDPLTPFNWAKPVNPDRYIQYPHHLNPIQATK